jgi:hypothetical protein
MKSFVVAVLVVLGMSVGASFLLERQAQSTVATTYATQSVRVGDPGENLTGPLRLRHQERLQGAGS